MMTLQAQASSSFTIGIPSFASPLGRSRHRFVVRAQGKQYRLVYLFIYLFLISWLIT